MVDPVADFKDSLTPRESVARHGVLAVGARTSLPKGGELVILVDFLRARGEISPDDVREFSELLRISIAAVEELLGFARALLKQESNGERTLACGGLTCSLHGAERLRACLASVLDRPDRPWNPRQVHCLGQCDAGPSIRVGRSTFVARALEVRTDVRAWREDDGGVFTVEPS